MALYGLPQLVYDPGSITASIDRDFSQTAKRTYRIYADVNDSEYTVGSLLPPGLALYSTDAGYAGYIVIGVKVTNGPTATWEGDGKTQIRIWMVEVDYGPFSSQLNSITGDPIDMPPRFRFQPNRKETVATEDVINKTPILNTAGDPFDPPVPKDGTAQTMLVRRNEANPNWYGVLFGWADHVNEYQWLIFPPRTVKIGSIEVPEPLYSQKSNRVYYPFEYTLDINLDTWDLQLVNQGYREINPDNDSGELRNILDSEGQPISTPMLLDADGRKLNPPVNENDIIYYRGQIYPTLDFSQLGLDNLFVVGNGPPPGSNYNGGNNDGYGGGF